jgi:small subunit ribosomal protein S15
MALSKELKQELVAKYGDNEKDTGNVKVQIAILTSEINALTLHLKSNKHDGSSRRGLFSKVGQRRGLLDYLSKKDYEEYTKLIKDLGIRK